MESLKQKLSGDLKAAMKSKDELRTSALRMVLAAIANKEIELRKKDIGLSDEEVMAVLRSEIKKRRDSVEGFMKGGREEAAAKEKNEIEILSVYLPAELSDDEIARVVKDGIREAGAAGTADFSKVMKIIMPVLKGKADGERVSRITKEQLVSL